MAFGKQELARLLYLVWRFGILDRPIKLYVAEIKWRVRVKESQNAPKVKDSTRSFMLVELLQLPMIENMQQELENELKKSLVRNANDSPL